VHIFSATFRIDQVLVGSSHLVFQRTLMASYLDVYKAVRQAKRNGKSGPPRLNPEMRSKIEMALMGTQLQTIFDAPLESRLWREFRAACLRLDRSENH
jgi:hypothetical protein